jgi:2-C-methyl-D-erythritol 4-phosphate cytidylyltransferase
MGDISVIIPAGGYGKRFSDKEKKQFYRLSDREILYYTLLRIKNIVADEIIIGCSDEDIPRIEEITDDLGIKNYIFSPSGEERQHTVYNCLLRASADYVLIHDAARPFLSRIILDRMMLEYKSYPGLICGIRVKDTVKLIYDNLIEKTVDRNRLLLVHTPQIFNRKILTKCLSEVIDRGELITDEAMALEYFGYDVGFVESEWYNIKITTMSDLGIAEYILNNFDILAGS